MAFFCNRRLTQVLDFHRSWDRVKRALENGGSDPGSDTCLALCSPLSPLLLQEAAFTPVCRNVRLTGDLVLATVLACAL